MKILYIFCLFLLCWSCESETCPKFDAQIIGLDTISAQQNKYFTNSKGDTICFSFLERLTRHKDKSTPTVMTADVCRSSTSFLFLSDSNSLNTNLDISYTLKANKYIIRFKMNNIPHSCKIKHLNELDTLLKFRHPRLPIFFEDITLKEGNITQLTDTLQQEWYRINNQ